MFAKANKNIDRLPKKDISNFSKITTSLDLVGKKVQVKEDFQIINRYRLFYSFYIVHLNIFVYQKSLIQTFYTRFLPQNTLREFTTREHKFICTIGHK